MLSAAAVQFHEAEAEKHHWVLDHEAEADKHHWVKGEMSSYLQ